MGTGRGACAPPQVFLGCPVNTFRWPWYRRNLGRALIRTAHSGRFTGHSLSLRLRSGRGPFILRLVSRWHMSVHMPPGVLFPCQKLAKEDGAPGRARRCPSRRGVLPHAGSLPFPNCVSRQDSISRIRSSLWDTRLRRSHPAAPSPGLSAR